MMIITYLRERRRKINLVFLTLAISSFFVSCGSSDKKGHKRVKVMDGDTVKFYNQQDVLVIKEWHQNRFDTSSFVKIRFYEDGGFKDSCSFYDGRIDGERKYYRREDSTLIYEIYVAGVQTGPSTVYYRSGKIKCEGDWLHDGRVGEWRFYYPDGKLNWYKFYSEDAKLLYIRKYSENLSTISYNGNGIIGAEHGNDTLDLGEYFYANLTVVNPPKCKFRLRTGRFSKSGKVDDMNELSVHGTHSSITFYPVKIGMDSIPLIWEIVDSMSNKVEHGMQVIPIYVRRKK